MAAALLAAADGRGRGVPTTQDKGLGEGRCALTSPEQGQGSLCLQHRSWPCMYLKPSKHSDHCDWCDASKCDAISNSGESTATRKRPKSTRKCSPRRSESKQPSFTICSSLSKRVAKRLTCPMDRMVHIAIALNWDCVKCLINYKIVEYLRLGVYL